MGYPLIRCHASNFKGGRASEIKYIVIHFTAGNGDTAQDNCNYFANNANLDASAHYFVDEQGIYRSVLEIDTAWHCGTTGKYYHKECRNQNIIGVELCSRKRNGVYYFMDETVDRAVDLTRELMDRYNIPASNVLRHYDVTHKICPAPFVDDAKAWQMFKGRLDGMTQAEFNKMANNWLASLGQQDTPAFAADAVRYFTERGIVKGDANGNVMANKPLTRAEYCVLRKREIDAGL